MKLLSEVPLATLPRLYRSRSLCQVFLWLKYIATNASLVVWSSSVKLGRWPKLTTRYIWLAGQFMILWPDHQPLCQKRLDWCAENLKKKIITERRWDCSLYWISAGISGYWGTHLILVTRIEIKEGDGIQQIAKVFCRMDLLCSY